MAEANTTLHIDENSPEQVAYKLMRDVGAAEGKNFVLTMGAGVNTDRKWILDTYAECLRAVRGHRS